jgi:hypothetical protein
VLNQLSEVGEDAMSNLWSQEASRLPSGADLSGEHEVEGDCRFELISCFWCFDLQVSDDLVELLRHHEASLMHDPLDLLLLFLLDVLLGKQLLAVVFNELISSVALTIRLIFDHEVFKLLLMTLYRIMVLHSLILTDVFRTSSEVRHV